jgi:RNA polymerase sigma factor (TIGR02999 family)
MTGASASEITQLLQAWSGGSEEALEQLIPLVNEELYRQARRYMARERAGHTLQASALINEVYLRLIDWRNVRWEDRAHFFGVAAGLMRRALVDHARRKRYAKRGGGAITVSLDPAAVASPPRSADLVAIDDALKSLAAFDARKSRIVELRFFGGLTVEETAEVLKVSPRTIKREWSLARAWLYSELS